VGEPGAGGGGEGMNPGVGEPREVTEPMVVGEPMEGRGADGLSICVKIPPLGGRP
jgi:hypothetical protein